MSPDLWDDLGHLFLRASDLPSDERAAFLDAACAGAPALRRRVETLLAVEAEAEAFFDAPSGIGVLLATVDLDEIAAAQASEDLPAGARLGPWEIEGEVGRGGVGAVYRAHRADGLYSQTVALKVVKRGMDTDALLARFGQERAVLAGLEHAGIARLVDGGSAPDGRPYLAMEFVDGEPITAYADRRRLGIEDRIGLFLQVCEAVAFAHRRLVVHRDLKPSNVLVAEDVAGRPRVKLLDFGLAAVLAGDDDALTQLTRDGGRLLTPEYAAPEQFDGGLVTTATDVYALGVMLYELLAGRRPYAVAGRPLAEIERIVREEAPPRPSTVPLDDAADAPARPASDRAAERGTSPQKLGRRLRGDLDTVVLQALRKEPDRRYPTVEAFAGDLRRHLAGLPVSARPDRAAYRAHKFVRRHRWGVSAAALVAFLLAGFGGQAVRQSRATAAAHDRAEVASAFVLDLLAEADPREGAGGATPVRDVLGRAARRAEGELGDRPDLLARVLLTVGRTLAELGEYDRAERPLRQALALARGTSGPDGPDAVEARIELAEWARAQGRYAEADAEARRAAAAGLGGSPEGALLRARALRGLAAVDADRGRFDEAVAGYHSAVATLRRAFPGGHRQTGLALAQLGGVLSDLDSLDASAAALREAATMQRRLLGPAHPEVAATWMSLGNTFELRDSLDAAANAHRQALVALRGAYGDLHGLTAMALHNLASAEDARGHKAEAARLYRQSLATKRRLYGDVHGSIAATLINLGYLQFETGDAAGAEATTREALRVARAAYGDGHYRTAIAAYNLGEILLARRRDLAEAERIVGEALVSDRQTYGPDGEGTLQTQLLLGRVQAARGACGRARPALREALAALGDRLARTEDRRAAEAALSACDG